MEGVPTRTALGRTSRWLPASPGVRRGWQPPALRRTPPAAEPPAFPCDPSHPGSEGARVPPPRGSSEPPDHALATERGTQHPELSYRESGGGASEDLPPE